MHQANTHMSHADVYNFSNPCHIHLHLSFATCLLQNWDLAVEIFHSSYLVTSSAQDRKEWTQVAAKI